MVSLKRDRANDEGPLTPLEGMELFEDMKVYGGRQGGSNNPHTDIPVALLLTWDVSASDFLPYMLKGAPQVRLFGPGPTMGAFGTFFQYSFWGGLRWSLGAEDSLSASGLTLCGRGVYPDEVVVPKQSDLLEGKDTVHEAALRWLREEIEP
jgi:C-terminal processing protease CtpA/Prc